MIVETFTLAQAATRLGLLVTVCMDCGASYRAVDAAGAEGGISHGLCDACAEKRETEDAIRDFYAQKDAATREVGERLRAAIAAGAPRSVIERLERERDRAGYTGD